MLTWFLTALVLIGGMYFWLTLRPTPAIDSDFGTRRLTFDTALVPDDAFKRIVDIRPGDRHKIGRADEARRRAILEDGMSWSSYGYYYPVDVVANGAGASRVTVGLKSKYPWQFGPIVRKQHEKANQAMVDLLKSQLA